MATRKLSDEDVEVIRNYLAQKPPWGTRVYEIKRIADSFGVSSNLIYRILARSRRKGKPS